MSGQDQASAPDGDIAPLPAYRRRRRALVVAVVFVWFIGALGAAADLHRMFGDPAVPTVDLRGRPSAPAFAFNVTGTKDEPLRRPVSVALTDDRVYVSDSLAGHVAVFRHDGTLADTVGDDRLQVPTYLSVSADGERLFVSDRALATVLAFNTADGSFVETVTPTVAVSAESTTAASAEETLAALPWAPIAVEAADDGTLIVSDVLDTHRILRLDAAGTLIRETPDHVTPPDLVLDFPNAVKSIGERVWVSDSNSRRLLEFGADGALVRSLPLGRLIRGFDVVLAEEGGPVYFALVDAFSHEVVLISESGSEVARFGGPGAGPGQFMFPNDVAVRNAVTWVVDTGNARVSVWEWGEAARRAANAVWPGGPSWLGLLSATLLGAPLALLLLLRPVRAAISPEIVPILSVWGSISQGWGRVRLLVPTSAGEPPVTEKLPPK
ncbi:MAG: hypothetical protein RBS78_08165 [Coriobacteriia bacterium]|nr:hypothetical protein [Coriobacteriia bacterium]